MSKDYLKPMIGSTRNSAEDNQQGIKVTRYRKDLFEDEPYTAALFQRGGTIRPETSPLQGASRTGSKPKLIKARGASEVCQSFQDIETVLNPDESTTTLLCIYDAKDEEPDFQAILHHKDSPDLSDPDLKPKSKGLRLHNLWNSTISDTYWDEPWTAAFFRSTEHRYRPENAPTFRTRSNISKSKQESLDDSRSDDGSGTAREPSENGETNLTAGDQQDIKSDAIKKNEEAARSTLCELEDTNEYVEILARPSILSDVFGLEGQTKKTCPEPIMKSYSPQVPEIHPKVSIPNNLHNFPLRLGSLSDRVYKEGKFVPLEEIEDCEWDTLSVPQRTMSYSSIFRFSCISTQLFKYQV